MKSKLNTPPSHPPQVSVASAGRPGRPGRLGRLQLAMARAFLPLSLGLLSAAAVAGPARDRLTLLVPDNAVQSAWQTKVWTDSAADEGLRMDVITDSQLLAMGAGAAGRIAGLVVPDSAHINASDAVVAALTQYANLGGKLMLVYDAGALTEGGFYPLTGNSRFKDLVGVDYVLYNDLRDQVAGFGPVVGTRARLDSLSFPPGKYLPYGAPTTPATSSVFVPTSRLDPGGTQAMAKVVAERGAKGIDDGSADLRSKRSRSLRELLGLGIEAKGPVRFDKRVEKASKAFDKHWNDRVERQSGDVAALLSSDGSTAVEVDPRTAAVTDSSLQVISNYAYGPVNYFSYVTTGDFPGTVHLSSPDHGLVAGTRSVGSGQVLFVNMPLGYFKAVGTDSAPLHGFLNLFARDQVGIASMSVQPRGTGGLIFNWHIDDGDDLLVNTKYLLDKTDILKRGPYSIHLTAGPDVITFGDGNGMNLPASKAAQDLVLRLGSLGKKYAKAKGDKAIAQHVLGSHGGWIHDYWGANADVLGQTLMQPLLEKNFKAIEDVTKLKITEYSSPVGNTPTWAVNWLEARGVQAMYLVADLGAGMLRPWRATDVNVPVQSQRLTSKMWSSPVTPLGRYATWEEFDEFGISDMSSGQWLLDLQSFVINKRSNRMFYSHPPGVAGHQKPLNALLKRADRMDEDRFSWYSMTELAQFSQQRVETRWDTSQYGPITSFVASNGTSLEDQTWLLPRSRYTTPLVVYGKGNVAYDDKNWIVTAESGNVMQFLTLER